MVNETQPGNDEPSEGEEDVQTRCAFHQVTFMELYYIVLYIPIEARPSPKFEEKGRKYRFVEPHLLFVMFYIIFRAFIRC